MPELQAHFVPFYWPGVLVAETRTLPILAWDPGLAAAMAEQLDGPRGAVYGFRFSTRGRRDDELDSRELALGPMHYIGCRVVTLAELEARNDPADSVLIGNMRANGWDRIVQTLDAWRWSRPIIADDIVHEAGA